MISRFLGFKKSRSSELVPQIVLLTLCNAAFLGTKRDKLESRPPSRCWLQLQRVLQRILGLLGCNMLQC